jgi:diacylglycerol kinase (ATP)
MKQITFILHGKIKHREKLIASVKAVFGNSSALNFTSTEHAQHSVELACNAAIGGATHIICIGGDGSLNEVVNGVMQYLNDNPAAASQVKVGVLPHGTGNDFARTMGVTFDIVALKKWIDENSFRTIDLGHTSFSDTTGKPANRYFVNITDVGIGGAIAHDLSTSSRFLGSFLTYQKALLKGMLSYKNKPVKVTADTFTYERSIMSLIVANGRFFGGGMGIAPNALPDDRLFSIVIIGAISLLTYLKNMASVRKSKKIDHPELKYLSASEILIESPEGPLPVDMDGEFIGFTPIKMKVAPAAINFIAPSLSS